MKQHFALNYRPVLWLSIISFSLTLVFFFRYTTKSLIHFGTKHDIPEYRIEGFSNRMSYRKGETIFLYINAKQEGLARVFYLPAPYCEIPVDSFLIEKQLQPTFVSDAESGCRWWSNYRLKLNHKYSSGYYKVSLICDTDTSYITFLVENRDPAEVAVLLPFSTWTAYNKWGGKSLYYNNHEDRTTYFVSTQRPNIEYDYAKDGVNIDINIIKFFKENYNAIILPDYALEYDTALLSKVNTLVLANHCEYFSERMYDNLSYLIHKKHKSLISLGGNQIYWKTKWHNNYTLMECRKDRSFFNFFRGDYGGRWRDHIGKAEHNLFGVQFTEAGAGTYAPYIICNTNHWILKGLTCSIGDTFGQTGMNACALSGLETDKIINDHDVVLLARGTNKPEVNGGAEFVIKELNNTHGILSTGAIQSGAGLGFDSTFTHLIQNFIHHYSR